MAAPINFMRYIFTGAEDEDIPRDATHFSIHKSVKVLPRRAFAEHPNIVELICHAGVERIEEEALYGCRSLKRLIIPGVRVVELRAFRGCAAVTDVECCKLERVGVEAFHGCESLTDINLPSVKIVESCAFKFCPAMTDVKCGKHLEAIYRWAFSDCYSLERLTIPLNCRSLEQITTPLKDDWVTNENTFPGCFNLQHVDLVEREVLNDTIAALLMEEWKDDMRRQVRSLNEILPTARAGTDFEDVGSKALVLRWWIRTVLRKIVHYKAEHRRSLNVAAASLKHALPNDIVMQSIMPFLELPSHTFEGEDEHEVENDSNDDSDAYEREEGGGKRRKLNCNDEEGGGVVRWVVSWSRYLFQRRK